MFPFGLQSDRLDNMANVELDSSDNGGLDFAQFGEEETRRSIRETTRVIGTARVAVGVTVSESDSDSSDATIVEITGTVIVKSIVHRKCTAKI